MAWAKQAPWLILARVCAASGQFVLLVSVAKLGGALEGRLFVLGLAICAPIFMFADLGLRSIYITRRPRLNLRSYMVVRVGCLASGLVAVGIIAIFVRIPVVLLALVALGKALDLVSDLLFAPLQEMGRGRSIFLLTFVNATATVCGAILFLLMNPSAVSALAGSVVGSLLSLSFTVFVVRRSGTVMNSNRGRLSSEAAAIVRQGAGVGAAMCLASVTVFVPQYVLGSFGTARELLVFAFVAYAVTASQVLINGVSQALLVELRRQLDAGRFAVAWRSGVNVLVLASVLAAVIGLVIVFLLPPLLPLSMGPLYSITHLQAGFVAATIVLVPSLFMGSSLIYALNAYSSLFYANVIALVATVAFAWYAIQAYSLTGAVACAALAVSVRAAMMWWGVRRHVLMHERHLKDPSGTAARIGDI